MKTILVPAVMILAGVLASKDKLTGRWETKPSEKGNITGVVFNKDKTYEGYINKKPFVSGKYRLRGSIITIEESGCNGAPGVYNLIFFSDSDSLRFEAISDTCTERRQGMSRTILGRVK
jgi:hypothetical protein